MNNPANRAFIELVPELGMIRLKLSPPQSIARQMGLSYLRREERGIYLCKPIYFLSLSSALKELGYSVRTSIRASHPLPFPVNLQVELRPYQEQAFLRWNQNGDRGVVVMPTGAGKTFIALKAIAELKQSTLIVVPTVDLLNQWHRNVCTHLGLSELQVGIWGGGQRDLREITIMTYDSASLHAPNLADRFGLLVFDEVHHLPAETYRKIAEESATPRRLGLTATPERVDGLETDLEYLVGRVVFSVSKEELERKSYVASFRQERVLVDLTPIERMRYEKLWAVYKSHLKAVMARVRGRRANPIQVLVRRIRFDENARIALDSWRRARKIALEADSKIDEVERLLKRFRNRKVLIFSEYVSIVNRIAKKFGIPKITAQTSVTERKEILRRFKEGRITKLVSGKVLDEGVDVPDASVGIIVSGSSTKRQYVQRLGRILRPKEVQAILVEIVSKRTTEMQASERRKRPIRV